MNVLAFLSGQNSIRYTREELKFATLGYLYFLLNEVFIGNDIRMIDSSVMLVIVLCARALASVLMVAVMLSTFVNRIRSWYGILHPLAFYMMVLVEFLVFSSRQGPSTYIILPAFVNISIVYFVIPARMRLKIVATCLAMIQGLFFTFRDPSLQGYSKLIILMCYFGLQFVGIIYGSRFERLRKTERAYNARLADENRFRGIIPDSFCNGIFLLKEGHVVDLSQNMVDLLGGNRQEIIGKDASTLFSVTQRFSSCFSSVPGEVPSVTEEGELLRFDGQRIPIRLTFDIVLVNGITYQGLIVKDITDDLIEGMGGRMQHGNISSIDEELPLTRRQREIAAELLRGLTRQQIADKLYITEDTVKGHITAIYRNLGIHSRVELARLLLK